MVHQELQYVSDGDGRATAVLVPIDLWHEIAAAKETARSLFTFLIGVAALAVGALAGF